jgi:hypothetical protein
MGGQRAYAAALYGFGYLGVRRAYAADLTVSVQKVPKRKLLPFFFKTREFLIILQNFVINVINFLKK